MKNYHHMHLNKQAFELIKTGIKTIEVRIYDEKRKCLKVGDKIVFENRENSSETLTAKVISLLHFKSFEKLFKNVSAKEIGFNGNESEKEMINCYYNYYSEEEEAKFGVIAIKIKA